MANDTRTTHPALRESLLNSLDQRFGHNAAPADAAYRKLLSAIAAFHAAAVHCRNADDAVWNTCNIFGISTADADAVGAVDRGSDLCELATCYVERALDSDGVTLDALYIARFNETGIMP